MCTTKEDAHNHWQRLIFLIFKKEQSGINISSSWNSASTSTVQARRIAALLSASSSLGPAMATTFLTGTWLDLGLSLVLADSLLVCLHSSVGGLLSTGLELVKGTGSELLSRLHEKKKKKVRSFLRRLSRRYAELRNVAGPACKWTAGI